jgi:hydrogenase nickel incorporation protein HypA/HybF
MHEASLMHDLLRHIQTVAQAHQVRRVIAVHLKVGRLSHCSPEHLRVHFEQAAHGTIAAGARLEVSVNTESDDERAQDVLLDRIEVED